MTKKTYTQRTSSLFLDSSKDLPAGGTPVARAQAFGKLIWERYAKWRNELPTGVEFLGQQNFANLGLKTLFLDDPNGCPTIQQINTYDSKTDAHQVRFTASWIVPIVTEVKKNKEANVAALPATANTAEVKK